VKQPGVSVCASKSLLMTTVGQSALILDSVSACVYRDSTGRMLFNGKPQATAFRDLYEFYDAVAFGLPLNELIEQLR
jgi:hypothetical protein